MQPTVTKFRTLDEIEPPYDDASKQPKTLTRTRHIDDVLYVAGRAPVENREHYDIMFVTGVLEEDEATSHVVSAFGFRINQQPEYLKGATGILRDVALRAGLDIDQCYYTAICKWLLPRSKRVKPSVKTLKWGMPILMDEIKRVKPRIIVCLGKAPFDLLSDRKIGFDDAHGGWFWSSAAGCHLYLMHAPHTLVLRPEYYETFRVDFAEIARKKAILDGKEIEHIPMSYEVIRDEQSLRDWIARLQDGELNVGTTKEGNPLFAVDCEWHGRTCFNGQLRTIQFAWNESDAVVIEFRNEQNEWSFEFDSPVPPLEDKTTDTEVGPIGPSGSQPSENECNAMLPKWTLPVDKMTVTLEARVSQPYHQPIPENVLAAYRQLNAIENAIAEQYADPEAAHEALVQELLSGDGDVTLADVMDYRTEEIGDAETAGLSMMDLRHDPVELRRIVEDIRAQRHERNRPRRKDELAADRPKYAFIGKIMKSYFDRDDVRFMGHQFSADAPWMEHVLGIDTRGRGYFDTEFAQQTVDESSELSLERGIAMKYTTMGMYNMDLIRWKKDNPGKTDGGYGYIPSDILIPYAASDVIATYRGYQHIKVQLDAQQLWDYYRNLLNPFVTDVFTEFHMVGLPMDVDQMDEMRELFQFVKRYMEAELQRQIFSDAKRTFKSKALGEMGAAAFKALLPLVDAKQPDRDALVETVKQHAQLDRIPFWLKMIDHLVCAPEFNIRSPEHMRRWLFDVEGMEPIKSTNQKAKGMPSMAWEKVLELPPDRQKLFTPAVDKQTLQILAEQLPTLQMLLDLNAVGNICKAFLKEADTFINDDGEVETSENGLHKWLVEKDGRYYICPLYALTETGRSRSFLPNTLNLPAYVNKRISRSIVRVVMEAHSTGELPDTLTKWVGKEEKDIPSIRSCIKAPEGWVLVESDYQTAEVVALGKISGDRDLQRILEDPDPEWALLKPDNPYKAKSVRVRFADPLENGIPASAHRDDYIMHVWKDGKLLGPVTEDMLRRNEDGSIKHAKFDIHWSIAERIYEKPREAMVEKVQRNAGKVINFCVEENQKVLTRDRGAVAIRDIRLDDLLWDGVEWVSHEGVVYTGKKEVLEYQGLRATRLHDVWTVERGKVKLEEACAESLTLVRTAVEGEGAVRAWSYNPCGDGGASRVGLLLSEDDLRSLRGGTVEGAAEHGDGQVVEVSVPGRQQVEGALSGSGSQGHLLADAPVCGDEAALREGHPRVVAPLQGARYQGGIQEQGGVHQMGAATLHGPADHGRGLRQEEQRRALLAAEPTVGGPIDEPAEQGAAGALERACSTAVPLRSPGGSLHGEHRAGSDEDGSHERRDLDEACAKFSCGEAETYDILNAGSRHRFTCSGVLVSNSSAYGASPASLERKIEADTGVKPEPGTGQKGLDAIAARQPRATQFLAEMAEVPKRKGYYRCASGRIRHCVLHGAGSGVSWRVRNSIESALGREMRNLPMQESVGATAARACRMAMSIYKKLGLRARIMTCLYDSLVTLCPLEERHLVARLHTLVMSEINTWRYVDDYGDRVLQYGVDNEFNYRWSTRPSKEELGKLDDPEWCPLPARLQKYMKLTTKNWSLFVS